MIIDNNMDVIDSRDIIGRIEELEKLTAPEATNEAFQAWCDEYDSLNALQEQCVDYVSDWEYGVSLIRESYFTEYCRELVIDIGDIPSELPWYIEDHIDWKGVARELSADYMEVDFNGVTYFVR